MSITAAAPPNTINRAGGSTNVLSEAPVFPSIKTPPIEAKPRISPRIVVHSITLVSCDSSARIDTIGKDGNLNGIAKVTAI